jgi:hypothetical protein
VLALLQGIRKRFGPLLDDLDCVSAIKRDHGVAGRGLHVMALLQGIRKLFGPLLDDLDCVSTVEVEEDEVAAAIITKAPSARARTC